MQAYAYEPLPTPRHVRFLELAIKDDDDDDDDDHGDTIDIHVHVADLDDCDFGYLAVSYVWGSPDMSGEVLVRGTSRHCLPVTRALASVLKGIQDCAEIAHGLFWIDGVCINQGDLDEKQQQIPLMADIYKRAIAVITYIGPWQPHYAFAVEHMQKLEEYADAHPETVMPLLEDERF